MESKKCTNCEVIKPISGFYTRKDRKLGVASECMVCSCNRKLLYARTKKGLLKRIYSSQIASSRKRGHGNPEYTKQELIYRYEDDNDFVIVYNNWVSSGYDTFKSPSLDRKDDTIGYSFENIQVMTWGENRDKGHDTSCMVVVGNGVSSNDKLEFISINEAGRNGFSPSSIIRCCKGIQEEHRGYTWNWKN